MQFSKILRPLAGFVLCFSLLLLVPLVVSIWDETELATTRSFAAGLGLGVLLALILWVTGRQSSGELYRREGLAVVGLSWILAGVIAAIPFQLSDAIPAAIDAFFECISGLTTTGATVLGTENRTIESLPTSILLWRSMIQWVGGIGIILVFIILLPAMGVTGSRLLSSEAVGVADQANRPRMVDQAKRVFSVYAVLTALAMIAYWVAGLGAFDALCHAFTTLATGGFSNHNVSIGGYRNLWVEIVAIVFMFLAGCNFLLLARSMFRTTSLARASSALHSIEFRVYLGLTLFIIAGLTLSLWIWGQPVDDSSLGLTHHYSNFGRCLRDASFQTVSILTSTGYCNANFEDWPKPAIYMVTVCMMIGGCSGSTAGGFKVVRVVVCTLLLRHALRHFIRPRTVETLKIGQNVIPGHIVSSILALLLLWIAMVAAGTFVLDLDPRLDLVSAFSASVSMMSCVGPAISEVVQSEQGTFELVGKIDLGPYSGYGELHAGAKLFMCLQMLLGRLEILAPLVLLTPGFWRR